MKELFKFMQREAGSEDQEMIELCNENTAEIQNDARPMFLDKDFKKDVTATVEGGGRGFSLWNRGRSMEVVRKKHSDRFEAIQSNGVLG